MLIAKVIGTAISTVKDEKLQGRKLLVVQQDGRKPARPTGQTLCRRGLR